MRYISVAVLGVALLLPNISQACHRNAGCHGSGNCHGGCWGGGCHGGRGGCHGGWSSCHGGYAGCHGGCSGGHGYTYGGWDGRGYAYYDGGYYYPNGTMVYSNGSVNNGNGYIRSSSYYDPNAANMPYPEGQVGVVGRQARVEVILPDPNTELTIQGQRMSAQGGRRFFISPELESGKTYTYNISIPRGTGEAGKVNEDTRTVEVQAGKSITVDFSRPENMKDNQAPEGGNRIPPPSNKGTPPPIPQGQQESSSPPK